MPSQRGSRAYLNGPARQFPRPGSRMISLPRARLHPNCLALGNVRITQASRAWAESRLEPSKHARHLVSSLFPWVFFSLPKSAGARSSPADRPCPKGPVVPVKPEPTTSITWAYTSSNYSRDRSPSSPQPFPDEWFWRGINNTSNTPNTPNTSNTPAIPCLLFRDEPLHFAEFIRFGGHHCLGTAIASVQLRKLQIAAQKETFHGFD